MNHLTVATEDPFSRALEFASDNDVEGFKELIDVDASSINQIGLWYSRQKGSKHIVSEQRTPLMVAATYGSVDVVKFIVSVPEADVNFSCGLDHSTALHCATSGGSVNAMEIVKLLVSAGADPCCLDASGLRPIDVIVLHPKVQSMRPVFEELLAKQQSSDFSIKDCSLRRLSIITSASESLEVPPSSENGLQSPSESVSSPASKFNELLVNSNQEKKEYPYDPSLPDIKNSIYATDEFRMFSFKVRPCSRAYSHDWTECPFVHPGENARRRDPRKFHYSCVPCPEFRKGACRRGDMCEYAHGVFECWLHPAQYRTRLCKDGTSCNRRVCFFAHTTEELRPLYVSTGSAVPSPHSSASGPSVMDMAAALSLLPGSPSSVSAMSPSPFSQCMSPSGNGMSQSSGAWPHPNVPTLHLPGSNLQSSRLRSSLSARDMPLDNMNLMRELDAHQQLLNELNGFPQSRSSPVSIGRSGRTKTLTPSNLEDLFSAEFSSSPRFSDHTAASVFSPTHKSALLNQFQQQQSMLSPINTNGMSPRNVDHPLLQAQYGVQSPGRMSPRSVEPISSMGARLSVFSQLENSHQQLRSLSSRELGGSKNFNSMVGSPVDSWSNGKLDWSVNGEAEGRMRRSSSFELRDNGEEPDFSWVHTLVKESPPEMMKNKFAAPASSVVPSGEISHSNSQIDSVDHSVLDTWLEQMQIDQQLAAV